MYTRIYERGGGIFKTMGGRGKEDRVVNRSVKRLTGIGCPRRWWVKARVAREKSWRGCYHVLDREFIIPGWRAASRLVGSCGRMHTGGYLVSCFASLEINSALVCAGGNCASLSTLDGSRPRKTACFASPRY